MLHFRERSRSKCGTFDYLDHRPGGGGKKVSITAGNKLYDLYEGTGTIVVVVIIIGTRRLA